MPNSNDLTKLTININHIAKKLFKKYCTQYSLTRPEGGFLTDN